MSYGIDVPEMPIQQYIQRIFSLCRRNIAGATAKGLPIREQPFIVDIADSGSICLAPVDHVLCRLSAANTHI